MSSPPVEDAVDSGARPTTDAALATPVPDRGATTRGDAALWPTSAVPAVASDVENTPPGAVRRTRKLVVTLRPPETRGATATNDPAAQVPGGSYRAIVSVGAEGCDPVIRVVAGDAIQAILAEVPALVDAAEAQWAAQPRYARASGPTASEGQRTSPKANRGTSAVARGARPLHPSAAPSMLPSAPDGRTAADAAETGNGTGGEAPLPASPLNASAADPPASGTRPPAPPVRPATPPRTARSNGQLSLFGDV